MRNLFNISFGAKVVLLGVFSVLITALALLIGISLQSEQYNQAAEQKVDEVTDAGVKNTIIGVYNIIEAQGESVQQQVDHSLQVAEYVLGQQGVIAESRESIRWKAVNQYNRASASVSLPKILVGDTWLGQNDDLNVRTPVIDDITEMVGCTSTLFQRMNPAGDMLRVATNVKSLEGKRPVGTYIPAVNPDGMINPVIQTVLKGDTYHGPAFVVDAWYSAAYQPVKDASGQIIGMLFVGIPQENIESLREAIHEAKLGLNGQIYVLSGSGEKRGTYIIAPGSGADRTSGADGASALGIKDAAGGSPTEAILAAARGLGVDEIKEVRYQEPGINGAAPRWKLSYVSYYAPWDWVLVSEIYEDELLSYQQTLQAGRERMLASSRLTALVIALMVGIVSYLAIRTVMRPLENLAETANQIAAGNLNLTAEVRGSDEIGRLGQAFNQMTRRLHHLIQTEQDQRQHLENTARRYVAHMGRVSEGYLAEQVSLAAGANGDDPLVQLGRQLNQMTASLQGMIVQIRDAAQALSGAAAEIMAATTQQVTSASEQSAAVAQTTTTVDEVKTITEQNSLRSQEVADAAQRTSEVSRLGRQAVEETIQSMGQIKNRVQNIAENILSLSEQARQISDIVTTVNDIAAQSNMLALNAAVEAARAGEHGKGFGVVAAEVRSLAEQSRRATTQIKTILTDIEKAISATAMSTEAGASGVEAGVHLAAQSGESIERLTSAIDQSTQIATQVVAGGRQQTSGIEQIAQAMHQINQATHQGLVSTRQTELAAQNLDALAHKLTAAVERYKIAAG